jgi:hypothetical protein
MIALGEAVGARMDRSAEELPWLQLGKELQYSKIDAIVISLNVSKLLWFQCEMSTKTLKAWSWSRVQR